MKRQEPPGPIVAAGWPAYSAGNHSPLSDLQPPFAVRNIRYPWQETGGLRATKNVKREQLYKVADLEREVSRQDDLTVATRVQRVAMMKGMTHRVLVMIPPPKKAINVEKEPV